MVDQPQNSLLDTGTPSQRLRNALSENYPEIEILYSDEYLESVIAVPGRTFEYARDEKIQKALEWRRAFGVDSLLEAFEYRDDDEIFVAEEKDEKTYRGFTPPQPLVDVCETGAFCLLKDKTDSEGRMILSARTSRLNWRTTGVEAGLQYHVLVIEQALKRMRQHKQPSASMQSLVVYIDTCGLSYIPPPLTALTGMAMLLQQAYPDRIHRIYVGPVSSILAKIYDYITPYLRARSRNKIVLLTESPSFEAITAHNRSHSDVTI